MWPKLSNIDNAIYNNLITGSKAGMEANNRVAWVRVFSGAVANINTGKVATVKGKDGKDIVDKDGKVQTKPIIVPLNGLILSSTNSADIFKAVGESKLTTYGDSLSSGDMGPSFDIGQNKTNKVVSAGFGSPLRPSPIITGLEIKEGKDQISRECTLNMTAFTLQQMEYMQTYFLEPGYTLCIEYGWNSINGTKQLINTKGGADAIITQAATRNLNYDVLHLLRVSSLGDYDSFLGFIVGGTVTSDGDKWNISVRLRGAPGLPTFLQTQNKTLQVNTANGEIVDTPAEPKPFGVSETEIEGDGEIRRDRRFKNMFNQLPAQRQTDAVKALMAGTDWGDYLNFDAAVNKSVTTYANPGFIAQLLGGADNEIKVGESTIEKEKLFSKNKYIRFELAVKILNANSQFTAYQIGNQKLSVEFDISKAKIGAFPNMFSTKPSKLVIPGWMPDFAVYFLNEGTVDQLKGGKLRSNGGEPYGLQRNVIPGLGIQFVEQVALTKETDNDGLVENAGYWGYLKNLYINFDVFVEKLQQKNKNIREVFLDMLNEMSSAVNSFWNFQIVEGKKNGKVMITVIDENWVGKNAEPVKTFVHSGPASVFLDASIDISVPSEMTNQIISRRLSLANNPDEPIVGVGGFFNSTTDLFLRTVTGSDGKPRKTLTAEEKAAEDTKKEEELKEAAKTESEKIEKEISDKKTTLTTNKGTISNLEKEIKKIKSKYALLNFNYSDADEALIKKYKTDIEGLEKINDGLEDEIDNKEDTLDETKDKEAEDAIKNKQSALSNNLAKIDVLPKPEIAALPPKAIGDITSIDILKQNFAIYCLNDEPFFDRMKNDAFAAKKGYGTLSHPLPIKYNFKIMGTSGIRRGDTFNIIGIPSKYRQHGLFQVTQIEQNLEGNMWTTQITGEYRQKN
jgi:hypothetical protein